MKNLTKISLVVLVLLRGLPLLAEGKPYLGQVYGQDKKVVFETAKKAAQAEVQKLQEQVTRKNSSSSTTRGIFSALMTCQVREVDKGVRLWDLKTKNEQSLLKGSWALAGITLLISGGMWVYEGYQAYSLKKNLDTYQQEATLNKNKIAVCDLLTLFFEDKEKKQDETDTLTGLKAWVERKKQEKGFSAQQGAAFLLTEISSNNYEEALVPVIQK